MASNQQTCTQETDSFLNVFPTFSRSERFEFLKRLIDTFNSDEIKGVRKIATRATIRKRKIDSLQTDEVHSATVRDNPSATSTRENRQSTNKLADASITTAISECNVNSEQSRNKIPWWQYFKKQDVVALDCEFVTPDYGRERNIEMKRLKIKRHQELATVAIVDLKLNVLYEGKVKWLPNTFEVNKWCCFGKYDLINGDTFERVRAAVDQIINGKLVITCGGVSDFNKLKIPPGGVDYFDIQWFWRSAKVNDYTSDPMYEPHSLRSIYFHYFQRKIQTEKHSALEDAKATAELFKIYTNETDNPYDMYHFRNFSEIVRL